MINPIVIILVVTSLANLMSVAIFSSLRNASIPGMRRWLAANMIAAVTLVLFMLRDKIPAFWSVLVANGLLAQAIVLGYEGCRQFFKLPPVSKVPYAGQAVMLVGLAYWTYAEPSLRARIVLVSIFNAYVYACIAWTIWRHRAPRRPFYGYGFMIGVACFTGLGHAARGLVYGAGWVRQDGLLQTTTLNVGFFSLGMLALPALSIGMVMIAYDLMAERLERLANIDELTGALTRRGFFAKANAIFRQLAASGTPLSVAIIDLDNFKSINDRYGHAEGDRVLAHLGQYVRQHLREGDVFGRQGGEEFAILFPGLVCGEAWVRLEAMRLQLVHAIGADAGLPAYTFSAGVDAYLPGMSLDALLVSADKALYVAKTRGRNCVVAAAA